MNAAKYPWRALLRRGQVHPTLARVVPVIEAQARALAQHVGADQASAVERTLVERAALLSGAAMLLLEQLVKAEDPRELLEDLVKVIRAETALLTTLGLKARSAEQPSLASYLKARLTVEGSPAAVQAALTGRAATVLAEAHAPQLAQVTAEDAEIVDEAAA